MDNDNKKKRKHGSGINFKEQQKRKVSGQEYKNRKGNKVVAKKPPELDVCKKINAICKCYNKCKKINNEQKKKLFDHFYSLDLSSQGSFCLTHIHLTEIKRRRHGQYATTEESRRQISVSYTLPDGSGSIVNVCKKVFMDVLSLNKKKVEVLITKKKNGDITFKDKRGSHGNHLKKYTGQDRERIMGYINSLPKDESHYSREKTSKLYLSPVPTLTHSVMYYMRQLSVYNFSVHISDNNEAYMCVWNETEGFRGSNEIMSCLLKVLNSDVTEKPKLIIWCDNCTGQNKNRAAIFLLMFLTSIGLFTEITMKFLVSGHSYLPNDRHFAQIEKRKKVKKCFIPEDVEELIKESRIVQPYRVVKMNHNCFFNLQEAADALISTSKLCISKLSLIKVTKENPGYVYTKKHFSDMEPWEKIRLLKKNVTVHDLKAVKLCLQEHKSALSDEVKKNLRAMIPFLALLEHKQFYQQITN